MLRWKRITIWFEALHHLESKVSSRKFNNIITIIKSLSSPNRSSKYPLIYVSINVKIKHNRNYVYIFLMSMKCKTLLSFYEWRSKAISGQLILKSVIKKCISVTSGALSSHYYNLIIHCEPIIGHNTVIKVADVVRHAAIDVSQYNNL